MHFSFSLTGPNHWSELYPDCGGQEQSPIDIVTQDVKCDNNLTDFVYNGYDTIPAATFTVIHGEKWQAGTYESGVY